jgi:hypothetical protein
MPQQEAVPAFRAERLDTEFRADPLLRQPGILGRNGSMQVVFVRRIDDLGHQSGR